MHRGYIPYDTSTDVNSEFAEVTKPNQSESFIMMREDAVADPAVYLSGPNQWPDLPGFRELLEAGYYQRNMVVNGKNTFEQAYQTH